MGTKDKKGGIGLWAASRAIAGSGAVYGAALKQIPGQSNVRKEFEKKDRKGVGANE